MASEAPETRDLNSALMAAAGKLNLAEVQRLLASGASAAFQARSEGGWGTLSTKTALHCAIQGKSSEGRPLEGRSEVIRALIEAKADVNAKMESRCWTGRGSCQTAWDMASQCELQAPNGTLTFQLWEDPALLRLFLENGADPNASQTRSLGGMRNDGSQSTHLLNRVVKSGNVEVARALLECGADANAANTLLNCNERGFHSDSSETALHIASRTGNLRMARLLLEHGAEVDAVWRELVQESLEVESPTDDPRGPDWVCSVRCRPLHKTALHLALEGGHAELATLLVCAGADTLAGTLKKQAWDGTSPSAREVDLRAPRATEEWTSCEDLCRGDEGLLRTLRAHYSPETHHLFPSQARSTARAVLMAARRQEWPLPEKALLEILAFAV